MSYYFPKISSTIKNGDNINICILKNNKLYVIDQKLNVVQMSKNIFAKKFRYFENNGTFWISDESLSYISLEDVITKNNNKISYSPLLHPGIPSTIKRENIQQNNQYLIIPYVTYSVKNILKGESYQTYNINDLFNNNNIKTVYSSQSFENIDTLTIPVGIGSVFIIVGIIIAFSCLALLFMYFFGHKFGVTW